jgi:hypothetical protein
MHEASLKLADQTEVDWRRLTPSFGVAAKILRSIRIDHARAQHAAKGVGRRTGDLGARRGRGSGGN